MIEVLVALVIIGLGIGAVAAVFGTGLAGHQTAAGVDGALALAEDRIAAADALAPLKPSDSAGVWGGHYRWHLVVSPYQDGAEKPFERPQPWRLFRIEATVGWRDGRHDRQVSLATLRLVPAPRDGP